MPPLRWSYVYVRLRVQYFLNKTRKKVFKMNAKELRQEVRSKLPTSDKDVTDDYLRAAIWEVMEETSPGSSDADLYLRAAERAREKARKEKSIELPLKATDRLFGKALVKALAPKIEDLRRREFGSPHPPFRTATEAAECVERTSSANLAEWREESEERKRARTEIERLAHKYRIEIEKKATLLPYQKPGDEHVKWVPTVPGTFLCQLTKETHRMATQCGVPQAALVTHVLTGLESARSRAHLTTRENWYTLPSGEQIGVNEATVIFRARDLTDKELRTIYNAVRGHVDGKGTKGIEDKDVDLWELVQDLDGPPQEHGSKGQFWETVRERWNREHPDEEPYTTRNGVKTRYERILTRLRPPRKS